MIRCNPQGLCSYDYFLEGEGHRAEVEYDWTSEQGVIVADGTRHRVRKHGLFSGRWSLDRNGNEVCSAIKPSAFTRTLEVDTPMGALELVAASAFTRVFRVEGRAGLIATIEPVHAFTRRATIEIRTREFDAATLAFLFWLTALMWRRASSNSS
ncbi:MAG: hypothetical protein ACYTGZ_03910 [Planctomycetota bacterium]|jgi:hypothetical protein